MSVYNRTLIHLPRVPLPGRGRVRRVRPASLGGAKLDVRLASSDWYVLEEIFLHGEYDAVTSSLTQPPRTIVDLGANVGMSVRLWQTRYPNAKIVAVEPDGANVEMAGRNALDPSRVTFVRGCVAGSHREVHLDRSKDEYSFKMDDRSTKANGESVQAYTLAEVLEMGGIGPQETIDLLKCDIEGAEAEVFAECSAWIDRVRYLAIELHAPYTKERFLEDVKRAGSTLQIVGEQSKGDLCVLQLAQP